MGELNFETYTKGKPHLVILGAGASVATIPNGDANSKKISVMDGFIDNLGMRDVLKEINLKTKSDNLEDIFSELPENMKNNEILEILENRIFDYFVEFKIPVEVTIYDFLILSLREKDIIATFNWDPLLMQAYLRVQQITKKLPRLLFLHGNVSTGYCKKDNVMGLLGNLCRSCLNPLKKQKLLYPIKNKDYHSDPFIEKSWKYTQLVLSEAFLLTIFGYSAPKTDVNAIGLLKQAWGTSEKRSIEEIEIIDVKNEDDLIDTWDEFIHSHHYKTMNSFFDSNIAKFPRRSCEAEFDRLFNCKFFDGTDDLKKINTFDELKSFYEPILKDEEFEKDMYTNFWL